MDLRRVILGHPHRLFYFCNFFHLINILSVFVFPLTLSYQLRSRLSAWQLLGQSWRSFFLLKSFWCISISLSNLMKSWKMKNKGQHERKDGSSHTKANYVFKEQKTPVSTRSSGYSLITFIIDPLFFNIKWLKFNLDEIDKIEVSVWDVFFSRFLPRFLDLPILYKKTYIQCIKTLIYYTKTIFYLA